MGPSDPAHIAILGAGIIGLTSSLVLAHAYPRSKIILVAKHFPGDRSIEYTSPWAGANWSSMANDNGPLEKYDEVTFRAFGALMDGQNVHGCQVVKKGEGNEAGLGRQQMWAVLDAPIEETNLQTPATGRIWYDELVGGLRHLTEDELPEGAVFGLEFPSTFRINTQVYLQWLQSQALSKGIRLERRQVTSINELLSLHPDTSLVLNATGLGALNLEDVRDTNMYPTRGQTVLVAEPKTPMKRMYEFERTYYRSPKRIDPTTTYVFPRTLGGGVILGGSRQDNDWSNEWDSQLETQILERSCKLAPELGKPEDLQIIARNIGLRPSRKGGPRIELEKEKQKWSVPVVHAYGHSGAGYQASWGTAERVLELVQKAINPSAKL
ncbi:FAD dependent oxidoreductase [Stagonosporopsis vannaccii]|nr:FAD dependent oxidoreductase [Stagonosporopsis vannaccii]